MNLSFKEQFPDGIPTYFIEKIQTGLLMHNFLHEEKLKQYHESYFEKFGKTYVNIDIPWQHEKVTSIREDKADRWKAGNKIHFIVNNRKPTRFQFAPIILCQSVQHIKIKYINTAVGNRLIVLLDHKPYFTAWADELDYNKVNDILKLKALKRMQTIAKNDGFNNVMDFFKWFNKDFEGKIIHWTDLQY